MSEFNEYNWKTTLTAVYQKSIIDPTFRNLCLTDPATAIAQVSDIELPTGIKLQFFDKRADYLYAFLLPPSPSGATPSTDQVKALIDWSTLCTDITTTLTHPE